MAAGEDVDTSLQTQGTKLPSITVRASLLNDDMKTCPKCEHVLANGQGNNIHSTLAYRRCRCHRDWKYENICTFKAQRDQEPAYFANTSMKIMQKRFGSAAKTRCSSAAMVQHPKSFQQNQPLNLVKSHMTHRRNLPSLKLKDTLVYTINASEPDSNTVVTAGTITTIPSNTSLVSSSHKLIEDNIANTASITKLPIIHENLSVIKLSGGKMSPLREINTDKHQFGRPSLLTRSHKLKQFEFTHLLKYVSLPLKQSAADLFMKLDQDGDGHLSYTEVSNGLGATFDETSKEILCSYLKPVYHLLGDATYFGKRDFILCFCMAKLLREHKLPRLFCMQSIEFYLKTMKPLMSAMFKSATEDHGTIPIFVIEAIVKEHCHSNGSKIMFRKSKVTNLIEEDGLLSLVNTFILAPFLFEVM